jgi:hypothetical protein
LAGWDDPGAVDEVNLLHERDVLPHFRLPRYGRHVADLLRAEGVDDAGLAGVGVADEADRNLLGLLVEFAQLAEEVDERTLAKRMVQGGVEGNCRILL